MPNATITVDAVLKERLTDLASQTGQEVDAFVRRCFGGSLKRTYVSSAVLLSFHGALELRL